MAYYKYVVRIHDILVKSVSRPMFLFLPTYRDPHSLHVCTSYVVCMYTKYFVMQKETKKRASYDESWVR